MPEQKGPAFQDNAAIEITPGMLLSSIADEIKKPEYLQDILPNNFSYLTQLLKYNPVKDYAGAKDKRSRAYPRSVLRMFGNMLKGAPCVNAYAFRDLLSEFPALLKNDFILYKKIALQHKTSLDLDLFDRAQETISTLMYQRFNAHYDYFRQDPEKFLDELAQQIVVVVEEEVSIEQLRQTVIRFLEIGLGKLVWSPEEHATIWECTKQIAQHTASLMEYNIIDNLDDLDDLYWALIHRFCFMLDITGNQMPLTFYQQIKDNIASQPILLFELEELDTFLQTKQNRFMHALLTSEAKKRALDVGILLQ